jgi:hypothetical protein
VLRSLFEAFHQSNSGTVSLIKSQVFHPVSFLVQIKRRPTHSQTHSLIFNPFNGKLNPICHLLVLLGAHHILHVSRIRVKHRMHYGVDFHNLLRPSVTFVSYIT